ncbi:L-lactate permease [Escherichia coli]
MANCVDYCRGGVPQKLTVASGQFDIIRSSVISITDDQRLQVLLIGFSFGVAGRSGWLWCAVAMTGALLVGLGFKPLYAAGLCLIANTAPVAFGALGVPILVAGQVTGIVFRSTLAQWRDVSYRSCRSQCCFGW